MVLAESVDVIQNDSGKTLFHTECRPAARAGQNFAFAPDGMSIAVIRDDAVEIYPLPPLGPQDKAAIQLAEKTAPPATEATVDLSEISTRIPTSPGQSDAEDSQDSQQGSQAATSANGSISIGPQPTSPASTQARDPGTPRVIAHRIAVRPGLHPNRKPRPPCPPQTPHPLQPRSPRPGPTPAIGPQTDPQMKCHPERRDAHFATRVEGPAFAFAVCRPQPQKKKGQPPVTRRPALHQNS